MTIEFNHLFRPSAQPHFVFNQAAVEIGRADELSETEHQELLATLKQLSPWKKGPFKLFGHEIDSEWRSDWKWQRLLPYLPDLRGKSICDIGCNNGYYMFRMAAHQPAKVIGIEPVAKHAQVFGMLQSYLQMPDLVFDQTGVETIAENYPQEFDVVFCMGILYHHTDPVGILRKIFASMKTGATLIIDCMGIPGDQPVALTPEKRYARCSGIWFLPTKSALENWVRRAGFRHVEVFFDAPLTPEEQRATSWAEIESLAEGLDVLDPTKTIEGYPAPHRFYLRAQR